MNEGVTRHNQGRLSSTSSNCHADKEGLGEKIMVDIIHNIRACVKTDIGLKRIKNEDSFLIVDQATELFNIERSGRMYAIADGMGGQIGGDIASKMACRGMADYYSEITTGQGHFNYFRTKLRHLKSTLQGVHHKIVDYGRIHKEYDEMGTTLSVLVLLKNKALIAHVGDSRIYRLRRDILEQLTEDHTFAQLFIQKGYMTLEEAAQHPIRHVMTQVVGQGIEDIFVKMETIERGDTFLLCSDGLYDMLSDIEIKDILLSLPGLQDRCSRLVETALKMGGKDNVTVMVIQTD